MLSSMISVLILAVWLLLIPTAVGGIAAAGVDKRKKNLPFLWITGQIILWAVFQVICVPFVLMEKEFSLVVLLYGVTASLLAAVSIVISVLRLRRRKNGFQVIEGRKEGHGKWYYVLWTVFAALLVFQLVQAVRLSYGDGDDAYYVAVSTLAEESNQMYLKLPYTGGTTGLDARHGLAPFPIWIAFLARISGMRTVSVAHVAAPLLLIPMTYGIYYLIGRKICGKKNGEKLPLFLVFTQLLVLFGDYSFYTVENFMIARSRQGKAALGNIILPMMVFVLLVILERIQEKQKVEWIWWGLLAAVVTAGCLCSTLGALLSCLLVGVTGICAAACYRRWKILVPMALCCLPAVGFALLYLRLD